MVIKNRADLLAFLRDAAKYQGKDELTEVKSFIDENVELTDEAGNAIDVDAVWSIVPKSKVKATASLSAQADADEARLSGANVVKSDTREVSRAAKLHAGASKRDAGKKAYEAKARDGKTVFSDADQAESFGAWVRQRVSGGKWYPRADEDANIVAKTLVTTTNSAGGAFVPDDFRAELIDIRKSYGGILGSVVPITPMGRDVVAYPRQTGNLTVYAPGEAGAATSSDIATDNVQLIAKKLAVLTTVSSELFNDSAISVTDTISRDIVWSFMKSLETDALLGDGTATYHGYVGATYKPRLVLEAGGGTWTTDANKSNLAGFVAGAGNLWSELTLTDHQSVVSRYPMLTNAGNPGWLCSPQYYWTVMNRLAYGPGTSGATAGATAAEVVNGVTQYRFLGFPVYMSNAMPAVEANSQVCALFGDFAMGMKVGEVSGSMSIASSTDFDFDNDVIAIRGLTRNAITVHDVGNYSATAASRNAGPICGLITLNA